MTTSTGKPNKRPEETTKVRRSQAPGKTIESRENQLIRLAYDLAERKIRNGTATAQEVTYFLKMGSVVSQLEKAKLEKENQLLEAKTQSLQSQKAVEELYKKAMAAFRTYSGQEDIPDEND